ncbi:conserved hypothetical protein, partial [Aspergillus lentulus]
SIKLALVQMQETAETVGWLKHQSGGVPELRGKSRLIIYQGYGEVFLTFMNPGTQRNEYLGGHSRPPPRRIPDDANIWAMAN